MMEYGEWPTVSFYVDSPNLFSSLRFPLFSKSLPKILRVLSQPEWTRLTGDHLFAFPSSSFGFGFKLFSSFPYCWIFCSVFLSSDNFPFAFIFLHTCACTHTCPLFTHSPLLSSL